MKEELGETSFYKKPKLLDSSTPHAFVFSFSFSTMAACDRMRQQMLARNIEAEFRMEDVQAVLEEVEMIKEDASRGDVGSGGGAQRTTMDRVWEEFRDLEGLSKWGGGPPSNDRDRQYGA